MKIANENMILEPPEVVFPWIAEPEKAVRWQKDVKGGEILINKPEVVGTTFVMLLMTVGKRITGEKNSKVGSHFNSSGEPCAVKVACTVRKGALEECPGVIYFTKNSSPAPYLTKKTDDEIQKNCATDQKLVISKRTVGSQPFFK